MPAGDAGASGICEHRGYPQQRNSYQRLQGFGFVEQEFLMNSSSSISLKLLQGFGFVEPKQPPDISIKFQTVLTTISSSTDVAVQHITHLLTT